MEPVAPMAANASTLTNRPTTTVSVMLYMSWNTLPMSMGIAKRINSFAGSPWVMSKLLPFFFTVVTNIFLSLVFPHYYSQR